MDYKLGCSGGSGGSEFEDDTSDTRQIGEILIAAGEAIDSVEFRPTLKSGFTEIAVARPNKRPRSKFTHGGEGGTLHEFRLEKDEFVVSIVGTYGRQKSGVGGTIVTSLQVKTSKLSYPVLGVPKGIHFEYHALGEHEIIGLWGGSGDLLDRIGVIVRSRG